MLNIILKTFLKKIKNFNIRKKVVRIQTIINRFIKLIYNIIEKTKQINIKFQKMYKKKKKVKKFIFFKNLIYKNIIKMQIDVLIIFYEIIKVFN